MRRTRESLIRLPQGRPPPAPRIAPDFTSSRSIEARRRIAMLLAAGLPLPTVTALFGLTESEFQLTPDELVDEESTS
jgi:hypothetical protein